MNRRVLLISEHGDPLAPLGTIQAGGQNVYVRELAIALARRGYAVDVATHLSTAALPIREEPFPGVQILRFDAGRPGFVPKEELLGLAPVFTQQLADYVERSGSYPSLIHSNYWISGLMGMDLRHRWDIPQVHTFHSLGKVRLKANGTEKRSYAGVRLQIEQLLLHTADAILASNPVEADLLAANYRVKRHRVRILPCGVNPQVFFPRDSKECRERLGVPEQVSPLFFAGRFEENKGLAVLLRALSFVVHNNPDLRDRIRLYVAGGGTLDGGELSKEAEQTRALIADLGLQDYVQLVGSLPQQELAVYFGAATATVIPSFYETFGLVAVEAMACGCPVVASRTGGLSYTVRHGENGLLVPPGNVEALARALERMYREQGLVARLRHTLRNGVPEEFTWPAIAAKAGAIYDEVRGAMIAYDTVAGDRPGQYARW